MGIRFLGQIPIIQGIRESGDTGEPVALLSGNPSGEAFHNIAQSLKQVIETRNIEHEPTKKVEITTK